MASSSSRLCSDEELKKARADAKELIARSPIPDECKPSDDEQEHKGKKKEQVGKKKKLRVLSQGRVDFLLNYKCTPLPKFDDAIDAVEVDREMFKDVRTVVNVADAYSRHFDDIIRAGQERMRHDLETKGCVTYEATDDEEDNEP